MVVGLFNKRWTSLRSGINGGGGIQQTLDLSEVGDQWWWVILQTLDLSEVGFMVVGIQQTLDLSEVGDQWWWVILQTLDLSEVGD